MAMLNNQMVDGIAGIGLPLQHEEDKWKIVNAASESYKIASLKIATSTTQWFGSFWREETRK